MYCSPLVWAPVWSRLSPLLISRSFHFTYYLPRFFPLLQPRPEGKVFWSLNPTLLVDSLHNIAVFRFRQHHLDFDLIFDRHADGRYSYSFSSLDSDIDGVASLGHCHADDYGSKSTRPGMNALH